VKENELITDNWIVRVTEENFYTVLLHRHGNEESERENPVKHKIFSQSCSAVRCTTAFKISG